LRLVFSEAKGAQNVDVDVIEFVFLRRSREYNLDFERAEPGRLAYRRSGSRVARDSHKGVRPAGFVGHSICRPVNCPQVRQVAVYRANLAQAGPQVACDLARFRSHGWF
ncbi:hypothetical protein JTL90_33595, partial [Pseudomonas aeruginosa]|nr:hypothetical protein [Pseudomonas aeruginosa]